MGGRIAWAQDSSDLTHQENVFGSNLYGRCTVCGSSGQVIIAAVAAMTPGGPKSVLSETLTLKWANGILAFPKNTILHNVQLCQIYCHTLNVSSINRMVLHPRCVFINYNWINQLSNTTVWWLDICCLLHRYQLHVSALMVIFRLID